MGLCSTVSLAYLRIEVSPAQELGRAVFRHIPGRQGRCAAEESAQPAASPPPGNQDQQTQPCQREAGRLGNLKGEIPDEVPARASNQRLQRP